MKSRLAWAVLVLCVACGDDDADVDASSSDAASDAASDSTVTRDVGSDTGSDADGVDADGVDADGADARSDANDAALADASDAALADVGGDAASDAGVCSGNMIGPCLVGECLGCPAGGPTMNYLCTTSCRDDDDCTDGERPLCNRPTISPGSRAGICTPRDFRCAWGAVCNSPDTPIATPTGERAVAELHEGDLVYSVHEDQIVAVPIVHTTRTAVLDHVVRRVTLSSGRTLEISHGHPTATGEHFADLRPGSELGAATVVAVEDIPYEYAYTHDIRPASDTGTYFAAGAWIGSTIPE